MISKLHDRLGTAGFVIAVIALIAAVAGTAYAATGLNGKQKKEVTKIAKQYAGKNGKNGKNGTNGANGKDGANGTNGADGKSVVLKNEAPPGCAEGGYTYEIQGSGEEDEVCNGSEGAPGVIHPGETLPSEASETGTWTIATNGKFSLAKSISYVSISFPIPLAQKIQGLHQHYINKNGKEVIFNAAIPGFEEVTSTECLGTVSAPSAKKGNLCVYASVESEVTASSGSFVNPETGLSNPLENGLGITSALTGAVLSLEVPKEKAPLAMGTWAVTAQ